ARISLAFGTHRPAGKNAILVVESFQTASSNSIFPATTSRKPALAFGASARESEGLRTSQSTKTTRAPPCAMSDAIAAARLDLPSLGKDDVKPMTLVNSSWLFKSTVSFIDRTASAYADDGESTIVRILFGPEDSAR